MINTKQKLAIGGSKKEKPIKTEFTLWCVIVNSIDEIWAPDLVDMPQFSKWNKGYIYLLMVIDVFSIYV